MTLIKGGLHMMACQTRLWVLPSTLIASLKQRVVLPGGSSPTTNDILGALLVASMAWLEPCRVQRRGGLNLHVVVNARGGG